MRFPDTPRHILKDAVRLSAGAALLVLVAVALAGQLPYTPSIFKVALENIGEGRIGANAASPFWSYLADDNAATSYDNSVYPHPSPTTFRLIQGNNGTSSCVPQNSHCDNMPNQCLVSGKPGIVGVISASVGDVGSTSVVRLTPSGSYPNTAVTFLTTTGSSVLLEWSCQDHQKQFFVVQGPFPQCYQNGDQDYQFADGYQVQQTQGTGFTTVTYDGANLAGSATVTAPAAGATNIYTLRCRQAGATWRSTTISVKSSTALLDISANPPSVYYGEDSEVSYAPFKTSNPDEYTPRNVVSGSCKINGGGIATDETGNNTFTTTLGDVDQLWDTPTNNFPTFEYGQYNSAGSGDLLTVTSGGNHRPYVAPFIMKSGKWYWEVKLIQNSNQPRFGMWRASELLVGGTALGGHTNGNSLGMHNTRGLVRNAAVQQTFTTLTNVAAGDTVMMAFDADAGKFWIGEQGSWYQGNPATGASPAFSGLTEADWMPAVSVNSATVQANFGQGGVSDTDVFYPDAGGRFKYAPPSGFKALSTSNYPTPTITEPQNYFDTTTWTGNGTTDTLIPLPFQPDMVWIKGRSGTNLVPNLYDSVRGVYKYLRTYLTNAEASNTQTFRSFATDGFTIGTSGYVNGSTTPASTYVAWAWKESPTAGFDIVSYTGDATGDRDIAHNLGATPEMVIVKGVSAATNWYVWHKDMGNMWSSLELNAANAIATANTPNSPWGVLTALTLNGGPSYTTGKIGQAIDLIKNSSQRAVGANADWYISAPFTMAMWVYRSANDTGDQTLFNNNQFILRLVPNGQNTGRPFEARLKASGGAMTAISCTTANNLSTWYHVAATWDGATFRLYKDGVQCASATAAITINPNGNAVAPTFGSGYEGSPGTNYFQGRIDDIRYYKSVLSAADILNLKNLNPGAVTAPIEGYFPLDGNTGSENFTASTFRVEGTSGNILNTNAATYIAYLFKSVDGLSKFGMYTGTGNSTGEVVYTGFRPKYVLLRNIGAANWVATDAERGTQQWFEYSSTAPAESTLAASPIEFRDTGFRLKTNLNVFNWGGRTFVYAAFADRPYKYSGDTGDIGVAVNNSLRFAYDVPTKSLSRTPSVSGNRTKFTVSLWFKPGLLYLDGRTYGYDGGHSFFGSGTRIDPGDDGCWFSGDYLMLNPAGQLEFAVGASNVILKTTETFSRHDWHHLVLNWDSGNIVSALRARLFVDGREITSFETDNRATLGATQTSNWSVAAKDNRVGTAYVGDLYCRTPTSRNDYGTGSGYMGFDGLMADMYFLDGYVVGPSGFAQEDSQGYLRPVDYSGPRGTNGFHLKFEPANPSPFWVYNITEPKTYTLTCTSSAEGALVSKSVTIGLKPPLIMASSSNASRANASNPSKYFNEADITTYSRVFQGQTGLVSWKATGAVANTCNMEATQEGTANYAAAPVAISPANTNEAWHVAVTPAGNASTTYTLSCPADWASPPTPFVSSSTRMVVVPSTCNTVSADSCDWRCSAGVDTPYVFSGNQPLIGWCCPAKLGDTGATVTGLTPSARAAIGTAAGTNGNSYTVTCNPTGSARTFTLSATTITGVPQLAVVPPRVRPGTAPTLQWNVSGTNLNQTTCTLSGPGVNQVVTGTGSVTASQTITSPARYQLFCDDGAGGKTVYATAGVLPGLKEI